MLISSQIESEIEAFKQELNSSSSMDIVRNKILFGDCFILDRNLYYSLRSKIAAHFSIHTNEVLIVGSAKLGFSIAPRKMYKHFGDDSDIDVVIVSSYLFDTFWKSIYHLWREKILWSSEADFQRYLFQGWIRPDKMPNSRKFTRTQEWWEFFRGLTSSSEFGPYKINGAIYKDFEFLQGYQDFAVQNCKNQLQ